MSSPSDTSGWFLCAGWRMVTCTKTSGGWCRKKVCSPMLIKAGQDSLKTKRKVSDVLCHRLPASAVNLDMRSGPSWVLANINVTGYYRVNYDLGNWERLFVQLSRDHQVNFTAAVSMETLQVSPETFSVSTGCGMMVCVWIQVIPVINRAQMVDDAFNLAR